MLSIATVLVALSTTVLSERLTVAFSGVEQSLMPLAGVHARIAMDVDDTSTVFVDSDHGNVHVTASGGATVRIRISN